MDLERRSLNLGEKPALIVVDMINGFTDPACPLGTGCPDIIAEISNLLTVFREKNLPIFFTTVTYSNPNQAEVFRNRVPALNILNAGSKWVEIDPRFNRQPEEAIIIKQWASAFFKTTLDDQLRELEVDSLVVVGLTTSGCVRATAVDGLQYDYKVVVPREAVGDRNQDAHEANLFDLQSKYTDVLSLEETLSLI